MKKEIPTPEQHPVDAFFREQEANIPVAFDPAHWSALQQMLEQQAQGKPVPAAGAQASDLALHGARPSVGRLLSLAFILVFLAAVPSANPAFRQTNAAIEQGLLSLPTDAQNSTNQPAFSNAAGSSVENDEAEEIQFSGAAAQTLAPASSNERNQQMPLDTIQSHLFRKGVALDSVRQHKLDSVSIRKTMQAVQDSIAEQKKKKKHLFW